MKACPGCGETDGLWVDDDPTTNAVLRYNVVCICGWQGPYRSSVDDAIKIWNTREVRP